MKKLLKILAISCVLIPFAAFSQESEDTIGFTKKLVREMNTHGVLNTIEIGGNIGTTGLGLEIASPITEWTKLRVGFDWMPHFTIPMNFYLDSYVNGYVSEKFDKIQSMMTSLSGMTIDKELKMESKPTMTTFRLLIDVYPFKSNRHWHFTAGFFYGGKSMGSTINTVTDMPSLIAMKMYNKLYDDIMSGEIKDNEFLGSFGIYLDPEQCDMLKDKVAVYGRLGVNVGKQKVIDESTGEEKLVPYLMEPDKDGTVSAKAKVNRFRPYIGFGYGGGITKDGKWQASFDAGLQFWGGAPKVTTHDGVVFNKLIDLDGEIRSYMNIMKALPVYPTIDIRLSYRF